MKGSWTIKCSDGWTGYFTGLEEARAYARGYRVAAIVDVITPEGRDGWSLIFAS
jgi:hypothetical protein